MLNVLVYARSAPLRDALSGALGGFADVTTASDLVSAPNLGSRRVVVAPVKDCSPEACDRLVQLGWRVVLLAPVPRESERTRYLACGATGYVPMTVQMEQLRVAVSSAAEAMCQT